MFLALKREKRLNLEDSDNNEKKIVGVLTN